MPNIYIYIYIDIHTDHLISARRPDLIIINKKEWICKIVDFAVATDHRIKQKDCEKKDKYLDLAKELKKLWNMKVTIIPIVIGAFGTVTKGLLKGLEDLEVDGRVETIQTTELLRTARILRRVLETWGDLLSLKFQWKTISLRWCENSEGVKGNNNNYYYHYYYYYYYHHHHLWRVFYTDGLSLEFEWHHVSSGLQDSSQYSGWSQ